MNLDYLISLKDKSGMTNEQIANASGVPESTVTRIFNGKTDNPYFQTIVDIVKALNGSVDEMEGIETKGEVKVSTEGESKLIQLYREIIQNKDRWIKFLVTLLVIVIFIFILLFAYDILNPTVGWFQY